MITYSKLADKFIDKGYLMELHYLVIPPPLFQSGKLLGTEEEQKRKFSIIVEEVYGEGWDDWNTWIDYQNYK